MIRALRAATLMGALTLALVGCDDDVAVQTSAAAADTAQTSAAETTVTAPPTSAATGGDRKVTFGSSGSPVPTILTTSCNPADPADCILPTNYPPAEVTGDLRGTTFSSSAVIGRNGVYPGVSIIAFTGEVEGCGTGGLLITTGGTYDPSTGLTAGEWRLNKDGGTGELADVAGSGTSRFDSTGGHFEGTISCG